MNRRYTQGKDGYKALERKKMHVEGLWVWAKI